MTTGIGFFKPSAHDPSLNGTPATTNNLSGTTSHAVSLPTGIVAGELLILIAAMSATVARTWTVAGFTLVTQVSATTGNLAVFKRTADGTEGSTVTATLSAGSNAEYIVYRATGVGVEAALAGNNFDPPSLSPSWGSARTLWIAAKFGLHFSGPTTGWDGITAPYGSLINAGASSGIILASATRGINAAASEDPNSNCITSSLTGFTGPPSGAFTIGIH